MKKKGSIVPFWCVLCQADKRSAVLGFCFAFFLGKLTQAKVTVQGKVQLRNISQTGLQASLDRILSRLLLVIVYDSVRKITSTSSKKIIMLRDLFYDMHFWVIFPSSSGVGLGCKQRRQRGGVLRTYTSLCLERNSSVFPSRSVFHVP